MNFSIKMFLDYCLPLYQFLLPALRRISLSQVHFLRPCKDYRLEIVFSMTLRVSSMAVEVDFYGPSSASVVHSRLLKKVSCEQKCEHH